MDRDSAMTTEHLPRTESDEAFYADSAPEAPGVSPGWLSFVLRRAWTIWMLLICWGSYALLYPIYMIPLLIGKPWSRRVSHVLNIFFGGVILGSGLMFVRTRWAEKLDQGPYVYIANHRTYLDIAICHVAIPRNFRFIGKIELERIPLFGYMFKRVHISLDRSSRAASVRSLLAAQRVMKEEGASIFIYPEGTTQHGHPVLGEFREGAFVLAIRAQRPVVPVVIHQSDRALTADGRFLAQPSIIRVEVLAPIPTEGLSLSDAGSLQRECHQRIYDRLLAAQQLSA
jgi:1-acyl-sn-glycerol-3-phosphate acyltransferase